MAPPPPDAPPDRRWRPALSPEGPPTAGPPDARPPRTAGRTGAGIAIGVAVGCLCLCTLSCLGLVVLLVALPKSGAVPGGQVRASTVTTLQALGLLEEGERIVYYYDDTLMMDDTRACVVTDRRFAWIDEGTRQEARWTQVAGVRSWEEMGTHVQVRTVDGDYVECEVAPLNGGEAFAQATADTWERILAARAGVGGIAP